MLARVCLRAARPSFVAIFAVILAFLTVPVAAIAAIAFTPGDFIGTQTSSSMAVLTQYGPDGQIKGTLTLPQTVTKGIRGSAMGPDGLLYIVTTHLTSLANNIHAIDAEGNVHATYPAGEIGSGQATHGKILFDNAGHFYVGGHGLTRFTVGDTASATEFYTQEAYDFDLLPSGNFLVAADTALYEVTPAGSVARQITPFRTGDTFFSLTSLRGIEYDPVSNHFFLGARTSGSIGSNPVIRFDFANGRYLAHTNFSGPNDMVLASDGRLVIASSTSSVAPAAFTTTPSLLGSFAGGSVRFISQVPEPSAMLLGAIVFAAAVRRPARKRMRGRPIAH